MESNEPRNQPMKLAEALQTKYLLEQRLDKMADMGISYGDIPEGVNRWTYLWDEYDTTYEKLRKLSRNINYTVAYVRFRDGTLQDGYMRRDLLRKVTASLRRLKSEYDSQSLGNDSHNNYSRNNDSDWDNDSFAEDSLEAEITRTTKAQIKMVPAVPLKEFHKIFNEKSKELRILRLDIERFISETELQEEII